MILEHGLLTERMTEQWNIRSKCHLSTADISDKDAQCILALIIGAVRAERFCDGALMGFFKDGSIEKWLLRLLEIDGGNS